MKKEERLHRLFGDIDDELVAQETATPIPLRVWLPRVTAAVAAVALVAGLALARPWVSEKPPIDDGGNATTTTTVKKQAAEVGQSTTAATEGVTELGSEPSQTTTNNATTVIKTHPQHNATTTIKPTSKTHIGGTPTVGTEIWQEPSWDELPLAQKYYTFDRDKQEHTIHPNSVDAALIGDYLEDVTLRGMCNGDIVTYDQPGHLYRINGISDACAVAVRYGEDTAYYPAVNRTYTPKTLGQFLTDLNLRETIVIGNVYDSRAEEDGQFYDYEYSGLTTEAVWDLLLSDPALPNEHTDHFMLPNPIHIGVSLPLLGYYNVTLSVSESGYIRTNLLDTGKAFFIGKDKVAAFIEHVQENCLSVKHTALPSPTNNVDDGTTVTSAPQPPLVTGTTIKRH